MLRSKSELFDFFLAIYTKNRNVVHKLAGIFTTQSTYGLIHKSNSQTRGSLNERREFSGEGGG